MDESQSQAISALKQRIQEAQASLEELDGANAGDKGSHPMRPSRPLILGMLFSLMLLVVIGLAAYVVIDVLKVGDQPEASEGQDPNGVVDQSSPDPTLIQPATMLPESVPADLRGKTWFQVGQEYFSLTSAIGLRGANNMTCEFVCVGSDGALIKRSIRTGEMLPLRAQIKLVSVDRSFASIEFAGNPMLVPLPGTRSSGIVSDVKPVRERETTPRESTMPRANNSGDGTDVGELPRDPRVAAEGGDAEKKPAGKTLDDLRGEGEKPLISETTLAIIKAELKSLTEHYAGVADGEPRYYLDFVEEGLWQDYVLDLLDSCWDKAVVRDGMDASMQALGAQIVKFEELDEDPRDYMHSTANLLEIYGMEHGDDGFCNAVIVELGDRFVRSREDLDFALKGADFSDEVRMVYIQGGELVLVWVQKMPADPTKPEVKDE